MSASTCGERITGAGAAQARAAHALVLVPSGVPRQVRAHYTTLQLRMRYDAATRATKAPRPLTLHPMFATTSYFKYFKQ